MTRPLVSTVVSTFNRRDDVLVALRSAFAQTYPAKSLEIIVVDDGSTDDTEAVVAREFGNRIRYVKKPNGGVASARNTGLALARGQYLALLDSDDVWMPSKIEKQVAWLEARPAFGLTVTDLERMRFDDKSVEHYARRPRIPEDGYVLHHVLRNPGLVPSSAMFRRAVYEKIGGFDEQLHTAEDIDFQLRIAARWPIGVIEETLTRITYGNGGLSELPRTYVDYVMVIERFIREHADRIDARHADVALIAAYARNIRGLVSTGQLGQALRVAMRSIARARTRDDAASVVRMGVDLARGLTIRLRRYC